MTNVVWPNGKKTMPTISSPYGPRKMAGAYSNFHYGDDFVGFTYGVAVLGGTVTLAGWYNNLAGNAVAVDSKDPVSGKTVTIVYMHAKDVLVKKGQKVKAGDKLLIAGSTGNATGICVHTELRYWAGGKYTTVNPATTIKSWIKHETDSVKLGRQKRKVGKVAVNGRTSPSTTSLIKQVLKPGVTGTFDGYRKAQSVDGNNIWFRGAYNHNWFWSGAFTDKSHTGLPEV